MSYAYLASPYTHAVPEEMEARYKAALGCLNWLLNRRIWTYSPIVHCHHLAREYALPHDAEFWGDYDKAMLEGSSTFFILTIAGWDTSKGVTMETEFSIRNRIPIRLITPNRYSEGYSMSEWRKDLTP